MNFQLVRSETSVFGQSYCNRQRLLARRAGCAPDAHRLPFLEVFRNEDLREGTNLVDLAPEEGFTDGQLIDKLLPLHVCTGVIFQQIVVIENRVETTLRHKLRYLIHQKFKLFVIEINS